MTRGSSRLTQGECQPNAARPDPASGVVPFAGSARPPGASPALSDGHAGQPVSFHCDVEPNVRVHISTLSRPGTPPGALATTMMTRHFPALFAYLHRGPEIELETAGSGVGRDFGKSMTKDPAASNSSVPTAIIVRAGASPKTVSSWHCGRSARKSRLTRSRKPGPVARRQCAVVAERRGQHLDRDHT